MTSVTLREHCWFGKFSPQSGMRIAFAQVVPWGSTEEPALPSGEPVSLS
ncbi:hypothetical protein BDK92_3875 [Micromonospora pisi]|uniref:Uncharacterized protein n=1 Tax=Micromonospora pisi TaxID=589240 RepID=A0A495JL05_9ACTN|nr:hypothetical protein BDK92_3875 [Micromonospora pisi]